MINQVFLIQTLLYGTVSYFYGHQGSHLASVRSGQSRLNPLLVKILWLYNITFLPWLVLIWLGFHIVWYYPVAILIASFIPRLILISIEMKMGWTSNAWAISLIGIVTIPLGLACMLYLASR